MNNLLLDVLSFIVLILNYFFFSLFFTSDICVLDFIEIENKQIIMWSLGTCWNEEVLYIVIKNMWQNEHTNSSTIWKQLCIVTTPLLCYQENIGGNIHLFAWYNFLQMFDVVDGEFTT